MRAGTLCETAVWAQTSSRLFTQPGTATIVLCTVLCDSCTRQLDARCTALAEKLRLPTCKAVLNLFDNLRDSRTANHRVKGLALCWFSVLRARLFNTGSMEKLSRKVSFFESTPGRNKQESQLSGAGGEDSCSCRSNRNSTGAFFSKSICYARCLWTWLLCLL